MLILATWVSLHYNIYLTKVKMAPWSSKNGEINADKYFFVSGILVDAANPGLEVTHIWPIMVQRNVGVIE